MSKFISFDEEQINALSQLAAARPRYWEAAVYKHYGLPANDTTEVLQYLNSQRDQLIHWRSILPPVHSMSLYVGSRDNSSVMYRTVATENGIEKQGLQHFEIEGYSAEKWLQSAALNLELLLKITADLLGTYQVPNDSLGRASTDNSVIRFNNPSLDDQYTSVLRLVEHQFNQQSAHDILSVYSSDTGELRMKVLTLGRAAFILEAIRRGLGYKPKDLASIDVLILGRDKPYSWLRSKTGNNAMDDAKKKVPEDLREELESQADLIEQRLTAIRKRKTK